MKTILEANKSCLAILRKVKPAQEPYRLMHYCISRPVDDGVLLFNVATRELLHLTEAEFAAAADNPVLRDRWFYVPESFDEKAAVDTLRWVLKNQQKPSKNITAYTVLPTTDCNARCFYCFELGRPRTPMSDEVAAKTADFMADHCGGEALRISWFGGEPLYHQAPIDIISSRLRQRGVEFKSTMISNAYLFDAATAEKAQKDWNLQQVQVTLDGTEAVYNKAKAFIYKDGSAYRRVLQSIGHLLDEGIQVTVRMNLDLYNAEDLMVLAHELAQEFRGKKGLSAYAHPLFSETATMKDLHSAEEWEKRYSALHRLEEAFRSLGLHRPLRLQSKLKMHHCMADNDASITVVPSGHIGICEHHTEDHFIGHVDGGELDMAVRTAWKQPSAPVEACDTCPCYPNCIMLQNCSTNNTCFPQLQESRIRKTENAMLDEYTAWLEKNS